MNAQGFFYWLCAMFIGIWSQGSLAFAALTCETEQNGKTGKITCVSDAQNDFIEPLSSDPRVVAITSSTQTGTAGNRKQIVQVIKKKEGSAVVLITDGDMNIRNTNYALTKDLFSMSVPNGVLFGEVVPSIFETGDIRAVTVKIIDTETGDDNSLANGSAFVGLDGSGFQFPGGLQNSTISIVNGFADVTVEAVGGLGDAAFFVVSDTSDLSSVGGTDVLHTAAITFLIPEPTTFASFVLGTVALFPFLRQRKSLFKVRP